MERTNFQLTLLKFKVHSAVNIIAGKANVPTNICIPLASFVDNNLNLQLDIKINANKCEIILQCKPKNLGLE